MCPSRKIRIHPDEFPIAEHMFREAVADYLVADDEFWVLDKMEKDILDQIKDKIDKEEPEKISEVKLERLARNHTEWKEYKEELYAARRNRGQKKVRYVQADKYWQTLQSGLAYKRDEMIHLSGSPG